MATTVEISPEVFNAAYLPHLHAPQRRQIYFGGSASGKSVFLAQRAIYDLMEGGRNYLVARQVARTVRGSVAQEIGKIIRAWGVSQLFTINKTDGTITCANGYQIVFVGLDDVEKLKSVTPARGVFTDIWIEEATETNRDDYKQLLKRQRGGNDKTPKRIVLSFNPILQSHWIYTDFFAGIGWASDQTEHVTDDLLIVKTTYKDNQFLTAQDIADLENETDPYFHNVYTLGNWGVLGDVIFTNWEVADFDPAQMTNPRHGLDFGYSSDPAALVATHYDNKHGVIYVYDELYETGLTNDTLADRLKSIISDTPITADSAEPKSIAELQKMGIDARAAKKGADSVRHGIDWLRRQKIVISPKCINFRNEIQSYQWKKDKGGVSLNIPVDKNNHLMDALRYAYEDESLGGNWLML